MLSGCASLNHTPESHDPWERMNRSIYSFNDTVDHYALEPVAKGYRAITPNLVEHGVSNFFSNLWDIKVFVNDVLQLKPVQASADLGRFLLNSTVGIAGVVDVASKVGLEKHHEDIGQTLAHWGVASGPYVVLPFLGPSTVRDGFGLGVDVVYLDPLQYVNDQGTQNALYALAFVDVRASLLEATDILDEAALDRYTFVREAYLQRRQSLIHDGVLPPAADMPDDEKIDIFSD